MSWVKTAIEKPRLNAKILIDVSWLGFNDVVSGKYLHHTERNKDMFCMDCGGWLDDENVLQWSYIKMPNRN